MKQEDEEMSAAWRAAAADLDIRVDALFVLTDSNGLAITWVAFVADFASPRGMLVRSLSASIITATGRVEFSAAECGLAPDTYGRYERHEWIDLLERARWYGAGNPPAWYTTISPWHRDAAALESMRRELARIFGKPVAVEGSAIYRQLYLLPADDVLAFLARVPVGGVTPTSFGRWANDVAAEWDRTHPRLSSRER